MLSKEVLIEEIEKGTNLLQFAKLWGVSRETAWGIIKDVTGISRKNTPKGFFAREESELQRIKQRAAQLKKKCEAASKGLAKIAGSDVYTRVLSPTSQRKFDEIREEIQKHWKEATLKASNQGVDVAREDQQNLFNN